MCGWLEPEKIKYLLVLPAQKTSRSLSAWKQSDTEHCSSNIMLNAGVGQSSGVQLYLCLGELFITALIHSVGTVNWGRKYTLGLGR